MEVNTQKGTLKYIKIKLVGNPVSLPQVERGKVSQLNLKKCRFLSFLQFYNSNRLFDSLRRWDCTKKIVQVYMCIHPALFFPFHLLIRRSWVLVTFRIFTQENRSLFFKITIGDQMTLIPLLLYPFMSTSLYFYIPLLNSPISTYSYNSISIYISHFFLDSGVWVIRQPILFQQFPLYGGSSWR